MSSAPLSSAIWTEEKRARAEMWGIEHLGFFRAPGWIENKFWEIGKESSFDECGIWFICYLTNFMRFYYLAIIISTITIVITISMISMVAKQVLFRRRVPRHLSHIRGRVEQLAKQVPARLKQLQEQAPVSREWSQVSQVSREPSRVSAQVFPGRNASALLARFPGDYQYKIVGSDIHSA